MIWKDDKNVNLLIRRNFSLRRNVVATSPNVAIRTSYMPASGYSPNIIMVNLVSK